MILISGLKVQESEAQPTKIQSILSFWSFDITEGFQDTALQRLFYQDYDTDSIIRNCLVIQNYDQNLPAKIALSYDMANWDELIIEPQNTLLLNRYLENDSLMQKVNIRVFTEKKDEPGFFKEYLAENRRCMLVGWNKNEENWDVWFTPCFFP
ncbi:MAG: hypothetical protein AAF587_33225 [Bacteroidota bacterium]